MTEGAHAGSRAVRTSTAPISPRAAERRAPGARSGASLASQQSPAAAKIAR